MVFVFVVINTGDVGAAEGSAAIVVVVVVVVVFVVGNVAAVDVVRAVKFVIVNVADQDGADNEELAFVDINVNIPISVVLTTVVGSRVEEPIAVVVDVIV